MKQESKMLKEIEKIVKENKEVLTKQFKVKEIALSVVISSYSSQSWRRAPIISQVYK